MCCLCSKIKQHQLLIGSRLGEGCVCVFSKIKQHQLLIGSHLGNVKVAYVSLVR